MELISWETILPSLICECAKISKSKRINYFSITNYAECWTGSYIDNNFDIEGPSQQCLSAIPTLNPIINGTNASYIDHGNFGIPSPLKYELCSSGQVHCAGAVGSSYIFGLENGMIYYNTSVVNEQ